MKPFVILLLFPPLAGAACLNGHPTVQKEYASSKLVFTGKVIQDHKTPGQAGGTFDLDGDTYTVSPTHVYKGEIDPKIDLFSENSSGRFPMEPGQEYLIFAYADDGRFVVDNCGNSNLISRSAKTIAEVARLSSEGK
jgi:hypothetical protein